MSHSGISSGEGNRFFYHRELSPLLWAFFAAIILETIIAHIVVAAFVSRTVAVVLSIFSLFGLIWIVGMIRSLSVMPILVSEYGVRVRCGRLVDQFIAFDQIASVDTPPPGFIAKQPQNLRACLILHPDLLIHLRQPLILKSAFGQKRSVTTISLKPDDPQDFLKALKAGMSASDRPG